MDDKVNLAEKLELLDRPYSPGIVGFLNDYKLAVAKVHGEFVWHKPVDTDDLFLVLRGRLTFSFAIAMSKFAKGSCSWFRAAWSTARRRTRRHMSF